MRKLSGKPAAAENLPGRLPGTLFPVPKRQAMPLEKCEFFRIIPEVSDMSSLISRDELGSRPFEAIATVCKNGRPTLGDLKGYIANHRDWRIRMLLLDNCGVMSIVRIEDYANRHGIRCAVSDPKQLFVKIQREVRKESAVRLIRQNPKKTHNAGKPEVKQVTIFPEYVLFPPGSGNPMGPYMGPGNKAFNAISELSGKDPPFLSDLEGLVCDSRWPERLAKRPYWGYTTLRKIETLAHNLGLSIQFTSRDEFAKLKKEAKEDASSLPLIQHSS